MRRKHGGKEGYIENLAETLQDSEAQLQGHGSGTKVAHIEYKRKLAQLQRQGKEGDKVRYRN